MDQNNQATLLAQQQLSFIVKKIQPGAHILLLGSQSPLLAQYLITQVPDSQIQCLDVNEDDLLKAKTQLSPEMQNVRLSADTLLEVWHFKPAFDWVIFCDYLLRTQSPQILLNKALQALVPGGTIAIKEGLMGEDYFSLLPQNEHFHNMQTLLSQLHELDGDQPRIGIRLKSLLHAAGFIDQKIQCESQIYQNKAQLTALSQWYQQRFEDRFGEMALANQRLTQKEYQQLQSMLEAMPNDPGAIVVQNWIQYIATKPENVNQLF